jgi:hypothetical protein
VAGAGGFVFDASVLIDYVAVDPAVLGLVAGHVGPVVIPLLVLAEVDGLDEPEATALGLTVQEPTDEQLDEAMDRPRILSFQDVMCFVTARDLGLTCVTNDAALATHCRAAGVPVVRGFRPLIALVDRAVISRLEGVRMVRSVHARNGYITRSVVVAFVREVRRLRP